MKGSPMQRNFGIGSPVKDTKQVNDGLGRSYRIPNVTKEQADDHNKDVDKPTHHDAKPPTKMKSAFKQGDPSDLTQADLDAMPIKLFNNPHKLGEGGNKKTIANLNRDDWREWYKTTRVENLPVDPS